MPYMSAHFIKYIILKLFADLESSSQSWSTVFREKNPYRFRKLGNFPYMLTAFPIQLMPVECSLEEVCIVVYQARTVSLHN